MGGLTRTWALKAYRSDPVTGKVVLADWMIKFADPVRWPGVESLHTGQTPVAGDLDADETTPEAILAAVQAWMAPQMNMLDTHHSSSLQMAYDLATAHVVVDLRSAEEVRQAMPVLSPRQMNLMLVQIGMAWAQLQAQIDAIGDAEERQVADIEFNRATAFRRDHPLVAQLAIAFGFSDLEMDTMWVYAADL